MEEKKRFRIILNDDSDTLRYIPPPHTEDKVALAVDYLKGTYVDCLCWCVGEQQAYSYPARKVESYFDKLDILDSKHFPRKNDLIYSLYKKGVDYLPLLIKESHKAGLSFIASFRMNDTHLKSDPQGVLASRFWQEHQQYRLWEITDGKTYYNAALDYSYPEVRNLYLTMISEVVERYNIDGIELDCCRNPYFFQPSEAWEKRGIFTDFMSEVKKLLMEGSRHKGKGLLLIVRIPFGEEKLKKAGIDLEALLGKKLPDILVMSDLANNYNRRIDKWLTLAHKNNVLFYPSIEADSDKTNPNFYDIITNPVAPWHSYNSPKMPEIVVKKIRGIAQNFLAQKPDGLYIFNYPCLLNERGNNRYKDSKTFKFLTQPLREIGSPETLNGTSKLYTYWTECPIQIETGRPARYHQTVNFLLLDPDVEKREMEVIIRFAEVAERNPHAVGRYYQNPLVPPGRIKYAINGKLVDERYIRRKQQPRGRILSGYLLRKHNMIEINVPYGILVCGENSISFEIPGFPEARDPYIYIYQLEAEVKIK
ncbi:MAG: family 10 glycosylhydrolase [Candidatus Omnitrophica bacterium]|nr:family 10 glycosylhydrolase [Candidatus Omnitrophota bacterium]